MGVKRIRTLAIEIFKTMHELNPDFMREIFTEKTNAKVRPRTSRIHVFQKSVVRPNNILVKKNLSAKYGDKSLRSLGPKIWNQLPQNVKSEISFKKFKEYINQWFGPICKCTFCKRLKEQN